MFKLLNCYSLRLCVVALFLVLSGCATFSSPIDAPSVKLISVQLLPSDNLEQRLAIGLRVTNPNPVALKLIGMRYSLRLDGYNLISGVSNDVPAIASYADTSVEIIATVDWLSGLRLLQSFMSKPNSAVSYEFDAKLDPGYLLPAFHVTERGIVDLAQAE